jgi:hypothetical protein
MTTLDTSFLRAVVLMSNFRGGPMKSAQAALLMIGLRGEDFLASDLPGEITNGSKHLAGAATGALVALGLIECVGRVKSPDVRAKGRKLDVWRIPGAKVSTARTWLRSNGYTVPETAEQLSLIAS